MSDNFAFTYSDDLEELVIPEGVTHINDKAFANCKNLKKVLLPESLLSIGIGAFSGCKNLEEIVLPNSITELSDECFMGCEKLNVILPKNIIKLGNRVFSGCTRLNHFPTNVESFGDECFKNCRSLRNVILNEEISYIPNGAFKGCTYLESVIYNGINNVMIGEKCFKDCKRLKEIPSFVHILNKYAFAGCSSIKEVTLTDTNIPEGCFRDCKSLEKINGDIYSLGSFAFSECSSLIDIDLSNVRKVSAEAFSNCYNLRNVKVSELLNRIESRAFYRCYNLDNFNMPDSIEFICKEAFRYCKSIKSLHIPFNLRDFGKAAFANMSSLEYIDSNNKSFITSEDHKLLIMPMQQKLVLYTMGSKDKSYTLKNYNVVYDEIDRELVQPISYIGPYVFAGAENLEELTICGVTNDIEVTAFIDCPNLKSLVVEGISFGTCPGFNIRDNGRYYFEDNSKHKMNFPFESIRFTGEITSIYPRGFIDFKDIKYLYFDTKNEFTIGADAFSNLSLVKDVYIPDNVLGIKDNAFNPSTILHFSDELIVDKLISMKKEESKYNNPYCLYTFSSDKFYIKDGDKISSFTKDEINQTIKNSELVTKKPIAFYNYMEELKKYKLKDYSILKNGILIDNLSKDGISFLLGYLKENKDFALNVLKESGILEDNDKYSKYLLENVNEVIGKIEILKKFNITNPLFYNKLLLATCSNEVFESLLKFDSSLFESVLVNSGLLNLIKDSSNNNSFGTTSNGLVNNNIIGNKLLSYMNFIKENNITSKFLMNVVFISNDSDITREFMLHFNNNLKRLVKASGVFDSDIVKTNSQNFQDLLILLKITGALEDDEIVSQRATTYITEKIFDKVYPNGEVNQYRIYGDDIHRIFNFNNVDIIYDEEFSEFFLENYKELYKLEIAHSGIIERIFKNFKDISRTSTSDRGSQRHLKVTVSKCTYFLASNKFRGVTEENAELATLIGWWYNTNDVWESALRIYNESLSAPRNIFAPMVKDKDDNFVFDSSPKHDLKEVSDSDYTYDWLPKQDYDNLVLGKYCSCCAHINGGGQGIMRASMIHDSCQNLVIRYKGDIIAKSTLYVNRNQGYAVFNNIEVSLKFNSEEEHREIYKAFMRGAKAFLEVYNRNYPNAPINKINIGINRNKIFQETKKDIHPIVDIEQSLYFGNYSLNDQHYLGDWSYGQQLVLKR